MSQFDPTMIAALAQAVAESLRSKAPSASAVPTHPSATKPPKPVAAVKSAADQIAATAARCQRAAQGQSTTETPEQGRKRLARLTAFVDASDTPELAWERYRSNERTPSAAGKPAARVDAVKAAAVEIVNTPRHTAKRVTAGWLDSLLTVGDDSSTAGRKIAKQAQALYASLLAE